MTILVLLLPLSLLFVAAIGGFLAWAVLTGQYDDTDGIADCLPDDD